MPIVVNAINTTWPDIPDMGYIPSLIELESCISLKHSRCWNTKSKLQTPSEMGVGLGQITIAYNKDGSTRFDALSDNKKLDARLKDLNWENITQRADLQILMIVKMVQSSFKRLYGLTKDESTALDMADSAYNGGLGGVLNARMKCSLKSKCNPNIWFGHVELASTKSRTPMSGYGGKSPYDINTHHVHETRINRPAKYRAYIKTISSH